MDDEAEPQTPGVAAPAVPGRLLQPKQQGVMNYRNAVQGRDSFEMSLGKGEVECASWKFGWETFGEIHIPYIFRNGGKYCSVRILEKELLNKYLRNLHCDIYSCVRISSYYITTLEARLLNEINVKHCVGQYGREVFTVNDLIVRLQDAEEFYKFLDICYNKLIHNSSSLNEKCGLIQINGASLLSYIVRDSSKYVPLFYFEGETEHLKLKAEKLEGWDLAYLKFCLRVQGIHTVLHASETCLVVSLNYIKTHLPAGTIFEDYWPSENTYAHLLLPRWNARIASPGIWTKKLGPPPSQQRSTTVPQVAAATNTVVASPTSSQPPPTPTAHPLNFSAAGPVAVQIMRNGWAHAMAHSPRYSHQPQPLPTPPLAAVNGTKYPTTMYSSGAGVTALSSHQPTVGNSRNSGGGSGFGSNTDPLGATCKLIHVGETTTTENHKPYWVQKTYVEGKLIHCINLEPYNYSELLMTLPDLINHFFPSVSLGSCRNAMQKVLNIKLYRGNAQQMTVLRDSSRCQLPQDSLTLVRVKDVINFMPQMKYIFIKMCAEENPSKKQRTN